MRLWHYKLLPYLPDAQLRGQLRELIAIMHDWRDKGQTNHLLINQVMLYPKSELYAYWKEFCSVYKDRFGKLPHEMYEQEFREFQKYAGIELSPLYVHWHTEDYLKVCMTNLYEKYYFAEGKTRITYPDWQRLLDGYKEITGKDYEL